jgi:hypothetical protein
MCAHKDSLRAQTHSRTTAPQGGPCRRDTTGETINDQVDWANIIDEVETVGRSERAALRRHVAVVLEHLIKLQASPPTDPRNGWKSSVLKPGVRSSGA